MEAPEPFVNAVDRHPRRAVAARLLGDQSLDNDQRADRVKRWPKFIVFLKVFGEDLAEKSGRDDPSVRAAELHQQQIAQAAAHRVADEERPGEHRHGRGNAQHHRRVRAPVERKASKHQPAWLHLSLSSKTITIGEVADRPARIESAISRPARRCG